MTENTIIRDTVESPQFIAETAAVVAAALTNMHGATKETISELIGSIHTAFINLASVSAPTATEVKAEVPEPAVSIRQSVKPDYIVCLEDGKKLKMLKRHLMTSYQMTPEQYRARWNLPGDYPMTAPNYAEKRRELAKKIGLGRKPGERPAPKATNVETKAPAKRGRPAKEAVAA